MNLVGTNTLEPQTEEDIESIEWMNKEEFIAFLDRFDDNFL